MQSVRTDAKKFYIRLQHRKKRNLLQRHFTADRPNQVWGSDITYFKINNSRAYLCTIIDLFSRRVEGYRISHSASTRLVTTTFRKAYAERGNPAELTFHSDRGGQYISDTFSKLLQNCHVKQSFSASGCSYDNAAAESFFATSKKEEAYRREYTSERHFQKCVEKYIRFYNEVRSHQTLDYKTPQIHRRHLRPHMRSAISKSCVHIATLIKENIFTIFMFAHPLQNAKTGRP